MKKNNKKRACLRAGFFLKKNINLGEYMKKIMFVCHGNICRSPMAEFIFKDKIKKLGLESEFYVYSSATSTEEIWG